MAAIILNKQLARDTKTYAKFRIAENEGGGGGGVTVTKDYILSASADYSAFEIVTDDQNDTCYFYIRTSWKQEINNVFVNWGDGSDLQHLGNTEEVSEEDYYHSPQNEKEPKLLEVGEYDVIMHHKYETPGTYKIQIYGDSYWGLERGEWWTNEDHTTSEIKECIISRVLDVDLPIAKCVRNLASWCSGSKKLKKIILPNYFDVSHVINWSGAFSNCINLERVYCDKSRWFGNGIYASGTMFMGCTKLKECKMYIPPFYTGSGTCSGMWNGCKELSSDISCLIPPNGFSNTKVNLSNTFKDCKSLTGNLESIADVLWNDKTKKWTTTDCFKGSSLSADAPIAWGGTKVIQKRDYGTVNDLDTTMCALSSVVDTLGGQLSVVTSLH